MERETNDERRDEQPTLPAERALVRAAAEASQAAFAAVWDNPEDAVYDDR